MKTTSDHVEKAAEVLNQGGIVIYPTDTAFGIGCRIDNQASVDRLFEIRRRPRIQATPVLVASIDMALAYFSSPLSIVRRLMDAYWPGALTIISPTFVENVYSPIRGDGGTIGLRMPDHQGILTIIGKVGIPILGPSANFHGEPTPFTLADLDPELVSLVDYIVPGECSRQHQASTVVDCTRDPYVILRQGAVVLPENI